MLAEYLSLKLTEPGSQFTGPKKFITNPSELATLPKKIKSSSDHNPVPFCNAAQSLEASTEKDLALRVMKAVADYYSLHRNLRLDFINDKPK
jgi:hypothetical protein